MKKIGIKRSFIFTLIALGLSLVLVWAVYYFVTIERIQSTQTIQTETSLDEIQSRVEEELLYLEDTAYEFSMFNAVSKAVRSEELRFFYDVCESIRSNIYLFSGKIRQPSNIIIYGIDGRFSRLTGTISNTALKRAYYMMHEGQEKTISLSYNNNTYIGVSEPVYVQNQVSGYVLCMIEQSRMLQLIGPYRELDYMGVLLLSGEELLCASPELVGEDMQSIRSSAEIIKEKQIGLSGFNLVVYSKRRISEDLSGYFRIAMPVTIAILLVVVVIFFMYMRRQTIAEMAQRAALDRETTRGILLQKQINAHFTVNTLNSLRALINKGDIEAATRICNELSTLLRYANEWDEYISLMDELYMLEQYIEIMKIRYPEHIDAQVEFDDIYEELMIPRMLLQPIVENAIVHGLQKTDGTIHISASLVRLSGNPDTDTDDHYLSDKKEDKPVEKLIIVISDTGAGMDERTLKEVTNSLISDDNNAKEKGLERVALKNIARRIRMICGPQCGLIIESEPGKGTTVRIILPVIRHNGKGNYNS